MQRWVGLIAAFLIAGCTTVAPAEAQVASSGEPPLIAGRVSLAEGDAQIWRVEDEANAGQWDGAVVNDVVTAGTGLYTGADGRNEVRVGPNSYRFSADSRGGFSQLDYSTAVFNLEYGTLNVRLAAPEHGETTAVTVAGVRVELVAPGRYRIDATDRGPMRLTVFEGHGTVQAAAKSFGVGSGQAVVVNPGGTGFSYEQPVTTAFDQWALSRDDQYRQVRAAQYVSPYMTGYETLDTYGEWATDVNYGVVWYPTAVPVGWAPYRYGQWRWVRPWGWTWVDYAPWGYAPFHYGRWVMIGPRWCWVPGGYVRRPVWAPALVGFVGSGVNVSVGIGAPLVGWYPLAPWHRYEPHYRHSPTYVTIINQTVINRVPPGAPRDVAHSPGATMVPGPRFRDPIPKVAVTAPQRPQDLKPISPPPLNVAPAPRPSVHKFSDQDGRPPAPGARPGTPAPRGPREAQQPQQPPAQGQAPQPPAQPGSPPTRVRPPMAVEPMPGRGVAPQPPMPGNDPAPLNQPPGLKRGQPLPAPQPAMPSPAPVERPAPRPHLPSDQLPPGQPQPVNPAEPPRFPPGAPPTIRHSPPPGMAGGARPVQPSAAPQPQAAPAPPAAVPVPSGPARSAPPAATPVPNAPARPAPPAAVPAPAAPGAPVAAPAPRAHPAQSAKEQALHGQADGDRGRPEREAPPIRQKQSDR